MFTRIPKLPATILGFVFVSNLSGSFPEEEVLVVTKPEVIVMPQGKVKAAISEIQAPVEVISVLEIANVGELRKAMPNFDPADTPRTTIEGNISRLPDFSNLFALRLYPNSNRDSAVVLLENLLQIIYSEKNQRGEMFDVFPNDDSFQYQWNLHNEAQWGGIPDADIDAPEAWDIKNRQFDNNCGYLRI
ncbi:hypothetical protein KAX35_06145 [candidate division WOR-3 bacterium]|nr:hypothetical protein [candidate division WOR-3 bacterium]